MKIALVCDWLTGMRGGERCLEVVCELYPDADIFTLVHFPGSVSKTIESHKIHTSYIQRLPGNVKTFRRYLPIFPHAIQQFDLSGYDCVLSFSHCVAKSVKVPPNIPNICYCHTPMRYAWHMRNEYLSRFSYLKRKIAEVMLDRIRNWDRKTSNRVTHFIASSRNVQERIQQAYNRDSVVIYPPVDCERFTISDDDDGYYLIVSAQVPYKRIDIAVQAFSSNNKKLVIIGNGPELPRLKSMASANVSFIDDADDNDVGRYMKKCKALVFPGEEDFGIAPLEALACGKPVIAFGKGGALETITGLDQSLPADLSGIALATPEASAKAGQNAENNTTGMFFYEQSPKALWDTILLFEKVKSRFVPQKCRDNALKFDRSIYKHSMQNCIQAVIAEPAHLTD